MLELIFTVFLGCTAGIITGLIPGVHINLISLILVSVSGYFMGLTSPIVLGIFIISMSVTHTFLDVIPSVFLGAPDSDQALNVLPCHRLLLEGKGFEAVKLATIGSLVCLILTTLFIPILLPIVPLIYNTVSPYMGYILLFVVIFMILKEKKPSKILWSIAVFLMSGVLGMIVLSLPNFNQPLFPLLSGLFGVSTLVTSLSNNVKIPIQKIKETITLEKTKLLKAFSAGTFSGSLTGIFPGLGSAQAAILGSQLTGDIGEHAFIVLIGGINTVNFVFSLATLYTLEKARNGAVVAVLQILESIDLNTLIVFLASALLAGGIATYLAMRLTRIFAKYITRISYPAVCITIILFITGMVFYFSSYLGIFILFTSTAVGITPALLGVKRSHAMGCLLLPVIHFFLV